MPILETQVVVGRIYATPTNQQRRVTKIKDGKVYYDARGGNVQNDWGPGHIYANPPTLHTFAQACNRVTLLP